MGKLKFSPQHLTMPNVTAMLALFITFGFLSSCATSGEKIEGNDKLHHAISAAEAGDTIVLKNGIWTDLELVVKVSGTEDAPIVIKAETDGAVVLSGNSYLAIAGDYVEVSGLLFTNGTSADRPVISFRSGERMANHSRVTNCAISYYNPSDRFLKSYWVELYGKNNRVDHCSFVGKLNAGVTLAVRLNGEENQKNNHSIDHNFFGERPRLGSNGGETLRVGTSTFSLTSSNTQILNNYFEHCNGEVEIISIKSCNNLIKGNTFFECEGVLTLRHGNNNIVTENVFIGNNKPHTGGVRVINAGHTITKNHFQELAGTRFRSAFGVMNGVPNSAINRYHRVKDANLNNNAFFGCENIAFGIGSDNERTAVPQNTTFKNNIIFNPEANNIVTELDDMSGIEFAGNSFRIKNKKLRKPGFEALRFVFEKNADGLFENADYKPVLSASMENTGAKWYKKGANESKEHKVFEVTSSLGFSEALIAAKDGDELHVVGDVVLTEPIQINCSLSLIGKKAEGLAQLKYENNKSKEPLIFINNGGELYLKNVHLNGASETGIANTGISTQTEPMIRHYNLFVENCEFSDFSEGKATIFRAHKSTFADSVVFRNCIFHTTSGKAINLKAEKEDLGKYNAEYVIVENCLFYNVMGSAIDLYRGGNDESTTGPFIQIDHCTFYNIENKELGSTINLTGVQDIHITNCIFSESGKSGRVIHLEDQGWINCEINHNAFFNCGRFESFYDHRLGSPNHYVNPFFVAPEEGDFRLSSASPYLKKSSEQTQLGYKY